MTLPKGTAVIALATMAAVTITASSSPVTRLQFSSRASPPADAPTIVGVWRTRHHVLVKRVKWRRFPLRGLFTFHEGGTASSIGLALVRLGVAQSRPRTVASRTWLAGAQHAFTHYRYDASGAFVGSQRVTSALHWTQAVTPLHRIRRRSVRRQRHPDHDRLRNCRRHAVRIIVSLHRLYAALRYNSRSMADAADVTALLLGQWRRIGAQPAVRSRTTSCAGWRGDASGENAPDLSLAPTALVHEAYLKLIDQRRVHWQNRSHFYSIAGRVMRRIVVDHARACCGQTRG